MPDGLGVAQGRHRNDLDSHFDVQELDRPQESRLAVAGFAPSPTRRPARQIRPERPVRSTVAAVHSTGAPSRTSGFLRTRTRATGKRSRLVCDSRRERLDQL